ncbi:MutS domain containing protein [Acanthamoeba castellanii str. Neff]|uniref:MutS domain containing protein n=1 Tax=Acanthamoeba castellanii (strain ATCC 30010 / Neff) TaxID=1257118 RepID=L8GVP0_ACACF|nr:MutS domain containing protein [Acanthamoeba castellanii str. Neff]ELR16653.1 MutS domain containing protein [Acanthamoeba castellanii str. Neff]
MTAPFCPGHQQPARYLTVKKNGPNYGTSPSSSQGKESPAKPPSIGSYFTARALFPSHGDSGLSTTGAQPQASHMQEETEWTDAQYDEPAGEKEAAAPTTSSFFSTPVTPIRLPKRGRDISAVVAALSSPKKPSSAPSPSPVATSSSTSSTPSRSTQTSQTFLSTPDAFALSFEDDDIEEPEDNHSTPPGGMRQEVTANRKSTLSTLTPARPVSAAPRPSQQAQRPVPQQSLSSTPQPVGQGQSTVTTGRGEIARGDRHYTTTPTMASPRAAAADNGLKKGTLGRGVQLGARPKPKQLDDDEASGEEATTGEFGDTWSWLRNELDAERRPRTHPNYDPSTLFIPKSEFARLTPAQQQYWLIKSKNWDSLVFFRVGKFFELYNKDADLGNKLFDLKLVIKPTRGGSNMRQCGVPVPNLQIWLAKLVALGHKVVIVDETETSVGAKVRQRQGDGNWKKAVAKSRTDGLVDRQVKQVLTAGTIVDEGLMNDHRANYILSIKEDIIPDPESRTEEVTYGICFVDCTTSEFNLGQFVDDSERNQLETLLLRVKPSEILYEKTLQLIKRSVVCPLMSAREPFLGADATVEYVQQHNVFVGQNDADEHPAADDLSAWPPVLLEHHEAGASLALSALSGLLVYFHELKLDHLALARKFNHYTPAGSNELDHLVLDGKTLTNLEIFENNFDKGVAGTLLNVMDHCVTPFGKRLFKRWIAKPLRRVEDIEDRLNAVEDLNERPELRDALWEQLKSLPDLERAISRIHAGRATTLQFISVLEAFYQIWETWNNHFKEEVFTQFKSKHLQSIVIIGIPDYSEVLGYFCDAFDWQVAKERKQITPNPGVDLGYDEVRDNIADLEQQLEEYLDQQRKRFGVSMHYTTSEKKDYLIEVPVGEAEGVDFPKNEFVERKGTKAVIRLQATRVAGLVPKIEEAKDALDSYLAGVLTQYLATFGQHFAVWSAAVTCVAELDCLLSLAKTSAFGGDPMCRPTFVVDVPEGTTPVLEVEELRHPCITPRVADTFIPNDIRIGGPHAPVVLLTGPNMGGKSTLLRQACISVIMAQMGCYVPASICRLTPVDRIFTRIGANDNIMAGQSTFMVELQETANILKNATAHSLVIMDELGRGTSTFDGYGIAYGVLDDLSRRLKCRSLFSTHYHLLTKEFEGNREIALFHMGCLANKETNVARAAGVMESVVRRAEAIATRFEENPSLDNFALIVGEDEGDENADDEENGPSLAGPLQPEEVAALREVQGTELNFIGFGKLLGLWSDLAHNQG